MRKDPPISTSWPLEMTTSRSSASAWRINITAAALLFTTMADSAPVSPQIRSETRSWREPRLPVSASISSVQYPSITSVTARRAASDNTARPRPVCRITPVPFTAGFRAPVERASMEGVVRVVINRAAKSGESCHRSRWEPSSGIRIARLPSAGDPNRRILPECGSSPPTICRRWLRSSRP